MGNPRATKGVLSTRLASEVGLMFLSLGRWQPASRRVESRSRTDDISDPTTQLGSCVLCLGQHQPASKRRVEVGHAQTITVTR